MSGSDKSKAKVAAAAATPTEPGKHRYNLAMDFIIAGFRNFHEGKQALTSGNKDLSKELKTKAMRFLLSAMETPGCAELVYSFNQINTTAALPEELDDDEGIDPASFSELDLSDFDDDEDDDSDDDQGDDDEDSDSADDADLAGGSEDSDTSDDDDTVAAASVEDEQQKLAMANMLSITGEPSHKRMALQLLEPESAK